jgi:uncharacterized protein
VQALRKKPRKSGFPLRRRFTRESFLVPIFAGKVASKTRPLGVRAFAISLLALSLLAIGGCGRKPLSKTESRVITAEIVSAAQRSSPRPAAIKIQPQETSPGHEVDRVTVSLANDAELRSFRIDLRRIAQNHHLLLGESGGLDHQFDFSFNGGLTHSVNATVRENGEASVRPPSRGTGPRLAIIIDDMGEDKKEADSVLALHFPVTLSVLPNLPFSQETAEEAHRHKDEVMLHLPMESQGEAEEGGRTKPEPKELRVGMAPGEVDSSVTDMLATVPYAAGVNNHQGSRATSNPALMKALMQSLRGKNLFFIDSRTTAGTIAYETAESFGIKAASRKVFLDDKLSRAGIAAQLELAASDAKRNGFAIAIGHPHPETIAVLAHNAPRLEKRGIVLVFPSELVH